MEKILICGYYGAGNLGDEAILSAMLTDLRDKRTDLEIIVASFNPSETGKQHNVQAILYNDLPALISATKACDLFILGGGGLFHDYWEINEDDLLTQRHLGISYYCSSLLLAKLFNKPCMIYGVGVGPLFHDSGKRLTKICFENADCASVRDVESLQILDDLGINTEKIHLLADPAFSLQPDLDKSAKIINFLDLANTPILGVCLRNWDVGVSAQAWQTEVARALDRFVSTYNVHILFIPFQVSSADILVNDLKVAENVLSLMTHTERVTILPGEHSPAVIAGLLGRCQLVLGMRLHSVILALIGGIPTISINYDPKVAHVMRRFGLENYGMAISECQSNSLFDRLMGLWEERTSLEESISIHKDELIERAMKNSNLALQTLEEVDVSLRHTPELEKHFTELLVKQTQARMIVENKLQDRVEEIEQLNILINEKNEKIEDIFAEKNRLFYENLGLEGKIQALSFELQDIKRSKAWALMMWLRKIRYWLIPAGSKREQFLRKIWQFFKIFPNQFTYNWQAYYFQRFKRTRNKIFHPYLDGLRMANHTDKVSIVLPVYNGEDYVREAVESILTQTYQDFELIAVNDGSTDSTSQILDEYARVESRMRVIHQENRGLPEALNTGFRHARGEYLTWTSSDNRLKPDYLTKMVSCLKEQPRWDAEYGNVIIIDEDGQRMINSGWYEGYQQPPGSGKIHMPKDPCELNVVANNYVGAAFMYRKHVDALLGDYSPFRFGTEDYDFWMRLNALLELAHTDFKDPLYEYRFHSTSLTSRDKELGITRSREGLMVFEDARRDFYNMPMAWLIKTDGNPLSQKVDQDLKTQIHDADHFCLNQAQFNFESIPSLWAPLVGVFIAKDPSAVVPDLDWPSQALKVLVVIGDGQLPEEMDSNWDLCLTTSNQSPLVILPGMRQGWLYARDIPTLFTAIDIREKSRQMAKLEKEIFTESNLEYQLSVIICTYHRGPKLAESIISVIEQGFPKDAYEILIVNNDPEDLSVSEILKEIQETYPSEQTQNMRLILCPYKGLSNARNVGISEARGEVLCFLDDDAVAERDWLEKIWAAFATDPQTGVVGGTINLHVPSPRPEWLKPEWESYWSRFTVEYDTFQEVNQWYEFPYGANWCARRSALLAAGGFRSRFGRKGSDFGGGEEILAAILIQKLGYKVAVEPRAEVMHYVNPDRFTLEHVKKTILAAERTWYRLQTDLYIPNELSLRNIYRRFKAKWRMRETWGRLKTRYALLAECHVLSWYLKDQLSRMRKILGWRW